MTTLSPAMIAKSDTALQTESAVSQARTAVDALHVAREQAQASLALGVLNLVVIVGIACLTLRQAQRDRRGALSRARLNGYSGHLLMARFFNSLQNLGPNDLVTDGSTEATEITVAIDLLGRALEAGADDSDLNGYVLRALVCATGFRRAIEAAPPIGITSKQLLEGRADEIASLESNRQKISLMMEKAKQPYTGPTVILQATGRA